MLLRWCKASAFTPPNSSSNFTANRLNKNIEHKCTHMPITKLKSMRHLILTATSKTTSRTRRGFRKSAARRHSDTNRSGNTSGLPSLPTELLLEILSYTRSPPIPYPNYGPPHVSTMERRKMLRNLTQVCHSLRHALFPILWETIEACTTKGASVFVTKVDPKWWKVVAIDLTKQLHLVMDLGLTSYVRTVNVAITPYNADILLPELARCMNFMPNLRTVQILNLWWIDGARVKGKCGDYHYSKSLFAGAFRGYKFPTVENVVLPTAGSSLLECFPEARSVFQTDTYKPDADVSAFVDGIVEHCPRVEYYTWAVGAYSMTTISDLEMFFYSQANLHKPALLIAASRLPNLRKLMLYTMYHDVEIINAIKGMNNLDTIVFHVHPNHETTDYRPRWEDMIKAACKKLAASSSWREKTLVIKRESGTEIVRIS